VQYLREQRGDDDEPETDDTRHAIREAAIGAESGATLYRDVIEGDEN